MAYPENTKARFGHDDYGNPAADQQAGIKRSAGSSSWLWVLAALVAIVVAWSAFAWLWTRPVGNLPPQAETSQLSVPIVPGPPADAA